MSAFIAHESRQIDQLAREFGFDATMSRDLAHLESLAGQWLVSTDILLGHGDTHLWEGAQDQADGIRDLLGSMALDQRDDRSEPLIARLDEIERLTESYVFPKASTRRSEILSRADQLSEELVLTLEATRAAVDQRQRESEKSLTARRARFPGLALISAALYFGVVVLSWSIVSRAVVRPLENLTASVREQEPDFTPVGPLEVRELASTLDSYAAALLNERQELAAAERRSREVAARLETVMRMAPDPIVLADSAGTIVSANESSAATFGFAPGALIGASMSDLIVDDGFGRSLPDGKADTEGVRVDGSSFPLAASIARVSVDGQIFLISIFHDLTARRDMEAQLRQAQRLESVGRLSAGVAHEINTPIQFVGDSIHYLEESFSEIMEALERHVDLRQAAACVPELSSQCEKLETMEQELHIDVMREEAPEAFALARDGIDRVAEIVRAMRRFTHPDPGAAEAVDVNAGIRDTAIVATGEYRGIAELDLDLEDIPKIRGHASSINRVVLNLIVNAAQSIAAQTERETQLGRICVRTRSANGSVTIEVEDDGPGVPDALQEFIFDPFFTTKDVGEGTGQGLALARSVAEEHGGDLTLERARGAGCVFRMTLPVEGTVEINHA